MEEALIKARSAKLSSSMKVLNTATSNPNIIVCGEVVNRSVDTQPGGEKFKPPHFDHNGNELAK